MRLLKFAPLLSLLAAAPAVAQRDGKPDLIVAISVDQFSSRLFEQYRPHFTGGLKRLSGGIVFAKGYQSHAATETCPGHATILTGAHPARSGIIANNWMDLGAGREDKSMYCAEDERVPGSTSQAYKVSSYHLKVPALGDRMKAADPQSRVVVVAGKDRSAIMMGGHKPDQRWWWSRDHFVTHEGNFVPPVAALVHDAIARALEEPRPAMDLSARCSARNRAIPVGAKTVGTHRFERAAGDAGAFTGSPELDGATLGMAAALAGQLQLGASGHRDLLAISLAATDYVGHRYGTEGAEMCLQLESLDADLGDFFDVLDSWGLDYTVVLTADHGGLDLPERMGPPAARVDPALSPAEVSAALRTQLGLEGALIQGDGVFGDMYIDRSDPTRHATILAAAKKIYLSHPQVEMVFTRAELSALPVPVGSPQSWTLAQRARASFDAERSGDLVVLLKPDITPIAKPVTSVATHGSPWDYDRQVPILFWWKGVKAAERREPARTVDILPTLAALIGLVVPKAEIDGRCIDLDEGPASAC
ncbi:MAG: alkaline phosphatase family protein [Sphingosinicella sp.]|nr:alkaline phosphatase family protein [Sphingosinicella sp.]